MNNLLVSAGIVVDVIFFVVLAIGLFGGVKNGFVRGVCAIAGTFLSLAIGVMFCRQFQTFIDETLGLGLTKALQGAMQGLIPSEKIANSVGEWFAIAISFLILVAIVRLLTWLLGLLGKSLVSKVKFFRILDRFLGGLLGLVQAALSLFLVLAICNWIPWEALHSFIASSSIVSKIVVSEWFEYAVSFPALIFKDTTTQEPEAMAFLAKQVALLFN